MATTSKKRPPLNKVGRTWESIIDGQTSPGPSFECKSFDFGHWDPGLGTTRKFLLELANYSDTHLKYHQCYTKSGLITKAPVDVSPGKKEIVTGTKQAFLATGCVGTISWELGNTGNILVVMYSVPFDHNLYSNWCGVGIFKKQDSIAHLFNTMYNEKETTCFARKKFKLDSNQLVFKFGERWLIKAQMGTGHTPEIQVGFYPCEKKNVAANLMPLLFEWDVFISYRRKSGSKLASLLKMGLEQKGLRVFLDVTNLEEGPFPVNLLESIRSSRTFLLLLTESVFDRCLGDVEMNDWVHKEVDCALRCKEDLRCKVIPVKDKDFKMPHRDILPNSIARITEENMIEWVHEHFEDCLNKINKFIMD